MAASQQLVRVKSEPTPAAVVLEGRLVYRSSAGVFSDVRAKLSADGQLTLAAGAGGVLEAGEEALDVASGTAVVGQPDRTVADRPFCFTVRRTPADKPQIFDAVSQAEQRRWLSALREFAAEHHGKPFREYTFKVELDGHHVEISLYATAAPSLCMLSQ